MAQVDIGGCISYGVDKVKKNPTFTIVGTLLAAIVSNLTMGIFTGTLMSGLFKGFEKMDRGEEPRLDDVFSGFSTNLVPTLVAGLVGYIVVIIGMFLCIIPGLLLAPIIPVSIYLCNKGETDGIKALQRAFDLMKPQLVMTAVASLVIGIVGGIGAILCGVGVLLTLPIMYAGWYRMAKTLAD